MWIYKDQTNRIFVILLTILVLYELGVVWISKSHISKILDKLYFAIFTYLYHRIIINFSNHGGQFECNFNHLRILIFKNLTNHVGQFEYYFNHLRILIFKNLTNYVGQFECNFNHLRILIFKNLCNLAGVQFE